VLAADIGAAIQQSLLREVRPRYQGCSLESSWYTLSSPGDGESAIAFLRKEIRVPEKVED
jgi:hypothetical protein